MTSHWETSAKSIYVRTVWINGVRHAILSKNDPLANGTVPKRPYSCGNVLQNEIKETKRNKKRSSSNSTEYYRTISISTSSSTESPIDNLESNSDIEYEYGFDTAMPSDNEEVINNVDAVQEESCERQFKYKKIKLPNVNAKANYNNSFRESNQNYGSFMKNNFINPITERVLNWLDLASKEAANNLVLSNRSDEKNGDKLEENDKTDKNNNRLENRVSARTAGNSLANYASAKHVEQSNETSERNRAWERQRNTLQSTQGNYAANNENNKGYTRNTYENGNVMHSQLNKGSNGNTNEAQRVQLDAAKQTQHSGKLQSSLSEETIYYSPTNRYSNTTNFMFDFTTPNIRKTPMEKNLKTNINPYSKHIRKNEEAIRRNNENISKLTRNIDEFQRTNEIICQTGRQKTTDRINNDRNNSVKTGRNKRFNNNLEDGDDSRHPNTETDNNNNNMNKGPENRTKSPQKKCRKSKSRRSCSSRESQESTLEVQDDYDDDFDDTIR